VRQEPAKGAAHQAGEGAREYSDADKRPPLTRPGIIWWWGIELSTIRR